MFLVPTCRRPSDTKPVICQVVHSLNIGGAEILARQFAERAREEYQFVFACLDTAGSMAAELSAAAFDVEVLNRQPGLDLNCARRLAQLCRRYHVRLIHAHQYTAFFYASLARWIGWQNIPIVFTEHGRDYPDYHRLKRVWANQFLLRSTDRVIGVGDCVRRALTDYEGIRRERIDVVYNGIDMAAFDRASLYRDEVRRSLGLDDNHIAVIQVARLDRLKDHPTALRAIAQLRAAIPGTRLIIVGDGEERTAIEGLIDELGLADTVILLGTRRDVPWLLQAADIFLLTSISEGIPLTLIEAMATGLPCVATSVGGVPEVIVDGQTGLLAPARDAPAIADCLKRLAHDVAMRQHMGQAGSRRVAERFDARVMHAAYRGLYRQLYSSCRERAQRSVEI